MTDLEAALGFSQMRRLEEFVAKRHTIAARYDELLQDLPVKKPWQQPGWVLRDALVCDQA